MKSHLSVLNECRCVVDEVPVPTVWLKYLSSGEDDSLPVSEQSYVDNWVEQLERALGCDERGIVSFDPISASYCLQDTSTYIDSEVVDCQIVYWQDRDIL